MWRVDLGNFSCEAFIRADRHGWEVDVWSMLGFVTVTGSGARTLAAKLFAANGTKITESGL